MSKNAKKTFILNDETKINSYGFRVLNSGINLERFKANPVMLDQHWNSTANVIGNWENPRIEGSQLLADANFDQDDEQAKRIAGKVERGFLKGASIGVSYNYEFMQRNPDDTYVLTQCELFEASIVAIPSNSNAVTLFGEAGLPLSQTELNEVKLGLTRLDLQPQKNNMSKLILSAGAIVALAGVGITTADDEGTVSKGIEALNAKLAEANVQITSLKDDNAKLEASVTKQLEANAVALVEGAFTAGKITADEKEAYLADAKSNYELTARLLAKLPGKTNLGANVQNPKNVGGDDPKNIDEFEKLPLAKQLAFKADKPEAYASLFN